MSGELVGEVYKLALPRAEKDVLLAMAENADSAGGSCFPGVKLLAWKTDLSERHVERALRQLESKNIVTPVGGNKGGRGHKTSYQIDISKAPRKPPIGCKPKPETLTDNVTLSSEETPTFLTETPTDNVTLCEQERVTFSTLKGDILEERVTFSTLKGDISDIAYKEEPSIEPSIEPSGEPSTNLEPCGSAVRLGDLFGIFSQAYEREYGLPYKPSRRNREADFGQLKEMVDAYAEKFRLSDWEQRAVVNYFETPQSSHSLKDLASRYAVFRRTALNSFGKPVQGRASPLGPKTAGNLSVFQSFLEQEGEIATG